MRRERFAQALALTHTTAFPVGTALLCRGANAPELLQE
jgi:hypothetical protein